MKMKPEHFVALKAAIEPLDTQERRKRYERGEFPRSDKVFDLARRYRWDLFWETGIASGPLHQYLDDAHIDTALKTIVDQGAWFRSGVQAKSKMRCPGCGSDTHSSSTHRDCPNSAISGM